MHSSDAFVQPGTVTVRTVACGSAPDYDLQVAGAIECERRGAKQGAPLELPYLSDGHGDLRFTAWLAGWRECTASSVRLLSDNASQPGLVVSVGEAAAYAARLLAGLSGRRHVALQTGMDVPAALEAHAASSECVVLLRDDLSTALAAALAARTRHERVGVVAADSLAILTQLVLKTLIAGAARDDGSYLVLNNGSMGAESGSQGAPIRVAEATALSSQETLDLLRSPWRFLAVAGDGNPVDSSVSHDSVLCGRPSSDAPGAWAAEPGQASHFCADMAHCARRARGQHTIFAADQLAADFVFLNSCFAAVTGDSPYARAFTLTSALQRSEALGFLSNIKQAAVPKWAGLLCAAQARSGLTLGDIAHRVSHIHARTSIEPPSLLLFADPLIALSPARHAPVECVPIHVTSLRMHLRATGHWTEVHVPAVLLTGPDGERLTRFSARVQADGAEDGDVLAAITPSRDGLQVDIFSAAPLDGRGLELLVSSFDTEFDAICTKVQEIDRQLVGLDLLCQSSEAQLPPAGSPEANFLGSMKSLRQEGDKTVARLLSALDMQPADACLAPDVQGAPTMLSRALAAGASRVRAILNGAHRWDHGFFLGFRYGSQYQRVAEAPGPACAYCGGPTFKTTLQAIRRPDVERFTHWCPCCTLICDSTHDGPAIAIEGPARIDVGGSACFAPKFAEGDLPREPVADVLLPEGFRLPWLKLSCVREADSEPRPAGALGRYRVVVDPATPPGSYYLVLAVVRDYGLSFATRVVQVVSPAGVTSGKHS